MKVGDHITIVKYGAGMWSNSQLGLKLISKDSRGYFYDWMPYLVNKKGIILKISDNRYSLLIEGEGEMAWFNEDQLQLDENYYKETIQVPTNRTR